MPYCKLFYHFVWTTKHRKPILTPEIEPHIYDLIRSKAIGLGATFFAIGGIPDHVHLVVSVPPKLALATFVGQVKGVTSVKANQLGLADGQFYWQEEYGVFSFDQKRLPYVVSYVEHQKQHHANQRAISLLEQTDESPDRLLQELSAPFFVDEDAWRTEFE